MFFFRTSRDIYFVWVAIFFEHATTLFSLLQPIFRSGRVFFSTTARPTFDYCDIIFERAPIFFWVTPCFFDLASFVSTKHQTIFDHDVFSNHSAFDLQRPIFFNHDATFFLTVRVRINFRPCRDLVLGRARFIFRPCSNPIFVHVAFCFRAWRNLLFLPWRDLFYDQAAT